ncbi:hypothetical protein QQZ08_005566 [Neonectria magnoliae]|uniref:Uncharacterized protein n=1 Tax=Neonectria magnoliae TaxID=2732573 RepID=A0ABR1I4V8_9HYPO
MELGQRIDSLEEYAASNEHDNMVALSNDLNAKILNDNAAFGQIRETLAGVHVARHSGVKIQVLIIGAKNMEANIQLCERVHGQSSSDAEDSVISDPSTAPSIRPKQRAEKNENDNEETTNVMNVPLFNKLHHDLNNASGRAKDTDFDMLQNRFIDNPALALGAFMKDVFDFQLTLCETGELESSPVRHSFEPFQLWCGILAERKKKAKSN